jgi:ribosomal subunit interface protein
MKQHDVIISGLNMDLTDAIRNVVEAKIEKLFEHEDHIVRMRVELEYDAHQSTHQNEFIAKGISQSTRWSTSSTECSGGALAYRRSNARIHASLIFLPKYPRQSSATA